MNAIIKNLALNAKVVSFDIFDTLLVRCYAKPKDLFEHLEKCFDQKGFANARVNAEFKACEKFKKIIQNIHYDEIYSCLPKEFQSLKEKEKELEIANLYVNPYMLDFLKEMKSLGKIIIISSDMYHCFEFIKKLLQKNNIVDYDKLYLSSNLQKAKADGELYGFIVKDLDVKPNEILHIGDNYIADYKNAKRAGLRAFYQKAPLEDFFDQFTKIKYFYAKNQNLTASIIVGLLCKKWLENRKNFENYWEYFGYFYAAPLGYGLSKYVFNEVLKENLKEFIFTARDGYIIKKNFDFLAQFHKYTIKTAYIYAPRAIYLAITCNIENELPWDSKSSSLISLYQDEIPAFKNIDTDKLSQEEKLQLIQENKNELSELSKKLAKNYSKYIQEFKLNSDKIGLFDAATYEFSTLKLLSQFLNSSILSYYEHIIPNEKLEGQFTAKQYSNGKTYLSNSNMLEFLITAPEFPIKTLNEKGEFVRISNQYEQKRIEIYKDIAEVQFEFCKDLISTFGKFEIDFENDAVLDLVNAFTENLNDDDLFYFEDVYYTSSISHNSNYIKMFQKERRKQHSLSGAVKRVKNLLSYKLRQALIKSPLSFVFKISSIVKTHRKQK